MTLEAAWQLIKTAFDSSPYLAAVIALILWLSFCWSFRLVTVGSRNSLPEILLSAFVVPKQTDAHSAIKSLHTLIASPLPQYSTKPPEASAVETDDGKSQWTLGEIYQIYWTLIARGHVVRYTTMLILFAFLCLLVMNVAQPKESVSLLNVANTVGVATLIPLSALGLLSFAIALLSAHQLPCRHIRAEKPLTTILFAW